MLRIAPESKIQNPKSKIPHRRRGFTLVEILMVVVIIGVLAGLLLAAAVPVRNAVRNWRMKSEIKQLELALEQARNQLFGGQYPPDTLNPADWQQCVRRAFPRYSGAVPTPPTTPAEALVFWLGGMKDPTSGNFIGFSSNPLNPFDASTNTNRIGPFFNFDRTRVGPGSGAGLYVYYPQNDLTTPTTAPPAAGTAPQPHVYFKAVAAAYTGTFNNAQPYVDVAADPSGATWVNPQSFQLMCPGLDGLYSASTGGSPHYPKGDNYGQNTYDDITNFTSRAKVESDMP
jgi:prepilin-type N-terminal cleavage/methylation domain-containing protein